MLQTAQQTIAWTPELDNRVLDLRDKGYSWPRIGELLGTSGDACRNRIKRLSNLKRKLRWTDERKAEFTKLYKQQDPQLSMEQIAARMNSTKSSLGRLRDELGLDPRPRKIGVFGEPNIHHTSKRKIRCDGKPVAPKFAIAAIKAAEDTMEAACAVGFDNGGISFADLTSRGCRFIKGTKHDPRYCEHESLPSKSWCEFHYGVVFRNVR